MVKKHGEPKTGDLTVNFGAGIHSRASSLRINAVEAADGQNFDLDLDQTVLVPRKPFITAGTTPNAFPVNGFAQLRKIDGTVSTLVQAGGDVYEWDGTPTGFTSVGTVSSAARLRGYDWHNWALDPQVVLITDIAAEQVIMRWDGTTFDAMPHNLTGDLYARYCVVDDDRASFANIRTTTVTQHVVLISKVEDYTDLTVTNKPSSALAEDDPVYLVMPNLRPINGMVSAFETTALSTVGRQMYRLDGQSAKDYTFNKLYPDSGATGPESVAYIGNDIAFGRESQIETLFTAYQLGDVKTDDLSRQIADLVRGVQAWIIQYDRRRGKVYCLDGAGSRIFVMYKPFVDERAREVFQGREPASLSPWTIWTTEHPFAFQTNVLMPMIDPISGLEEMFIGGPNGEVFRFEGDGILDAETYLIRTRHASKTFQLDPPGGFVGRFSGHILYNTKGADVDVDLTFRFGGEVVGDGKATVTLPGSSGGSYFGGGAYFGGGSYFGAAFQGRLAIEKYSVAGHGNTVQLEIAFQGDAAIEEVMGDFSASHA